MTALDSRNRSTILRDVEQLGIGAGLAFLPSLPSLSFLLFPTQPQVFWMCDGMEMMERFAFGLCSLGRCTYTVATA